MTDSTVVNKQVVLGTAILQDLVSRAAKGSTCVDIIPLSCMMRIQVKDNVLTISTTDNINWLDAFADVQANDFEVIVPSKAFSQIVSRITTATITLTIEDSSVVIKGNGTYTIGICSDADGSAIDWQPPKFNPTSSVATLTYEDVKSILTLNKSCKADNKQVPELYNYFFDTDCVITTDQEKACLNKISAVDSATMLPANLVELIPYVTHSTEGVTIQTDDTGIMFKSSIGTLYGKKCLQADTDAFPNKAVKEVFSNSTYTNNCLVQRTQLNEALDRMVLFTDVLQRNKITLTSKTDRLNLYSEDLKSEEDVFYLPSNSTPSEEVSFLIDAKFLQNIVSNCSQEKLNIDFDAASGVKISFDNDSTIMLSVLQ